MPVVSLPDGQTLRVTFEQLMALFKVPGASIAVFDKFHVVWKKGYGVREQGSSLPVTLDTTFQAGSISKPLTALAVMHLVQEGKLALDENVNDRLVSWKVPDNEFTVHEKVTLRRLLSHSAGLGVGIFPGYAVGDPIPTTVQILNGERPANTAPVRVERVPGSKFKYSGGGTTVVQLLLMDLLKKPFPQIMAETVIDPLRLKHSSYEQPQPSARAVFSATGHNPGDQPVSGKWHLYPEMAAAGLWTTPGDVATVAVEVADSRRGHSNKVISQASAEQMLTLQAAPLGIGFFLGPSEAQFGHTGFDEGFLSALVAFHDTGQGVVIMTNSLNGSNLFGPLAASVAKEYGWKSFTSIGWASSGRTIPMSTVPVRFAVISQKLGVEKAIADYATQRARGPEKAFGPGDLNDAGYLLLGDGKTEEAIKVFQTNAALYPDDANSYDSLGEAFMKAGKRESAIENYQRSLKLDPTNDNAARMLAKLAAPSQPGAGK
jgi:CubicO group peptidase (beta-lactamase class C family)